MKKGILILALATSFGGGFTLNTFISNNSTNQSESKRVTGIGGIFFKCKDPQKIRDWYNLHLGLNTNDYGVVFEWYQGADSTQKGFTQWSPFKEKTKYFDPSAKEFMINYRVENLDRLVEQLKAEHVTILDKIESYSYGKFIHIMDIEGNKIELWEPNDHEYEKSGIQMGYKTTK